MLTPKASYSFDTLLNHLKRQNRCFDNVRTLILPCQLTRSVRTKGLGQVRSLIPYEAECSGFVRNHFPALKRVIIPSKFHGCGIIHVARYTGLL